MNERFGPNRFERLEQGSKVRADRIAALRPISDAVDAQVSRNKFHERATPLASMALFMIIISTACSDVAPKEIHLEAERGVGTGEVKPRSNASNDAGIWFHEDEARIWNFEISDSAIYSVYVNYSNDGDPDKVKVIIHQDESGEFVTQNTREAGSVPGDGWNVFNRVNVIAEIKLAPGKHRAEVVALETDSYGVEIDEVLLIRADNEK